MPFLSRLATLEPVETWPSMEQAAEQRYWDGLALATDASGRETGAIYLLGYAAEMLVKTAYCRFIGYPAGADVFPALRAAQASSLWRGGNLHSLGSWINFLADTRALRGNPISPAAAGQALTSVLAVESHWREWLRYRATSATLEELEEVHENVNWIRRNYAVLWS